SEMVPVEVSKSRAICGIEGRNMSMDMGASAVRAIRTAVAIRVSTRGKEGGLATRAWYGTRGGGRRGEGGGGRAQGAGRRAQGAGRRAQGGLHDLLGPIHGLPGVVGSERWDGPATAWAPRRPRRIEGLERLLDARDDGVCLGAG